ncbi:MAG: ornithine cyclodeaminase family protein [bacterium]|nr:ornithine cyclodeaminase family protein [bacterium]
MRVLTAHDIKFTLTMRDAIEAVRAGFIALSKDRVEMPVRTALSVPGGVTLTMPAYVYDEMVSVVKIVSVSAGNAARGLPVVIGTVLVVDAQTGVPRALLDGTMLTAIRTGAGSGLATDLLAKPDAKVLAVIGAGAQARTQIEAVCTVREIEQVRIYSPRTAAALAVEISGLYDFEVIAVPDAEAALEGADVVVAATNSASPVFMADHIAPGVHINGVGSFRHDMEEIPVELVARAKIIIDHRESAWAEAGELIKALELGLIRADDVVEIGEVAAELKPGRTSPEQITFFKSVGSAVQDAMTAARVVALAEERNLGQIISL